MGGPGAQHIPHFPAVSTNSTRGWEGEGVCVPGLSAIHFAFAARHSQARVALDPRPRRGAPPARAPRPAAPGDVLCRGNSGPVSAPNAGGWPRMPGGAPRRRGTVPTPEKTHFSKTQKAGTAYKYMAGLVKRASAFAETGPAVLRSRGRLTSISPSYCTVISCGSVGLSPGGGGASLRERERERYAQMHRCTDAQMLRCSDAQMLRCSDAQMLRCTDRGMERWRDGEMERWRDGERVRVRGINRLRVCERE